jgi:glutamate synthase (NADPH/NADH) small chain
MIRAMGVEFRQAEVGAEVPLEELERDHAAVFLGMGLGDMRPLGIPGEQSPGVIDALHFIARYKTGQTLTVGPRVAVIGGGNTAIDAAIAARRLGADEVHVFYRRTESEMPAFPFEYDHAKREGVVFHWLLQPVSIHQEDGRAAAVKFSQTRLGAPDGSGRRVLEPVAGGEVDFLCQTVIPALGQSRLVDMLGTRGIEISDGSIVVDRPTGRTANPKYYAGGDCVNGGREVVDAVADGTRAGKAIAAVLAAR